MGPEATLGSQQLVGRLWDAHGGREAWIAQGGVRFAYDVRVPSSREEFSFSEVGFRRGDFRFLWVRATQDSERVRVALDVPPGGVYDQLQEAGGFALSSTAVGRDGLDYALRSVRLLFGLPLATTSGPWEFRSLAWNTNKDAAAEDVPLFLRSPEKGPLEVVFRGSHAPHGACLLERHPESGKVERIVIRGKHPYVQEAIYGVHLEGYEAVQGMAFATRRAQRRLSLAKNRRDPFPDSPTSLEALQILDEEIADVELLSNEEVDTLFPLPLEDDAGEVPNEGTGEGARQVPAPSDGGAASVSPSA